MEPGSESSSLKEFHPHSCLSAAWQKAGKRQAVFKPSWEEEEGRQVLRPQGDPCWRQRLVGLGAGPRDGDQDWDKLGHGSETSPGAAKPPDPAWIHATASWGGLVAPQFPGEEGCWGISSPVTTFGVMGSPVTPFWVLPRTP